jgi:hypothetical protein
MQGSMIFEGVNERATGAFEQNARPALAECGIEFRAVEAAPFAMDIAKKRVAADMTARRVNEGHQGCTFPAKVPEGSFLDQPCAMHAHRRKEEVAGDPPGLVEGMRC